MKSLKTLIFQTFVDISTLSRPVVLCYQQVRYRYHTESELNFGGEDHFGERILAVVDERFMIQRPAKFVSKPAQLSRTDSNQ